MDTLNINTHTNDFNYDDLDGTYWAELFTPELPEDVDHEDDIEGDNGFEQLTNEGE